ncbi:hypothetical protein ACPBEI_00795 [Latilactobacillus sakei]
MGREKVELPKFMCTLIDISVNKKINTPELAYRIMDKLADESIEANLWLGKFENRWKLIDALRYGYEPEPEPHWGIKAGKCYMKDPENCGFDNIASQDAAYWTVKSAADAMIKLLGFGEVVDLNKEGKTK